LYEVEKVDLGFNPDRVLSFQISLPSPRYNGAEKISEFYEFALQNIRNLPGVRSASAVSTLPLTGNYHFINLEVDADRANPTAKHPYVDSPSVLPGYFAALRCPILYGRDFTG